MVDKIISATDAKTGTNIVVESKPCKVKKIDISKTGKHGHSKVRIEAVGILDNNKRIFVVPGHERLEVPRVDKKKAQVLSIKDRVSLMDLETFETFEIVPKNKEIKNELVEGENAEYWDVEGEKIIKRKL